MTRLTAPALAALAGLLLVAALVRGQDPHPAPPAAPAWDYRLLSWEPADTEAVLRAVTGEDTATVRDMANQLAERVALDQNPAVLAGVDRRLTAKLGPLGAQGWEAFWVRDGHVILGGHLFPAPSVLLRRPRAR